MTGHARIVGSHVIGVPKVVSQMTVGAVTGIRIGAIAVWVTIILTDVMAPAWRTTR